MGSDWLGILVGGFIVVLVVGIPVANLVIKAGWLATELEPGTIRRSWSSMMVLENLGRVPAEYADEWMWSLSLAGWSATIASVVASVGIWIVVPTLRKGWQARARQQFDSGSRWSGARRSGPRWSGFVFAFLFFCFALPGPIASGVVIDLFEWPSPSSWPGMGLSWLRDHTLAAPILCLQFRLIPLACFAFLVMERRWQDRLGELWRIDSDKPRLARARVFWLDMYRPAMAIWGILFAIAFADLATYLPCLPPGVTPISMRIFDLLHYGVRSTEAGLLLFLALAGAAIGALIMTIAPHRR
jgi:hypothetical protein